MTRFITRHVIALESQPLQKIDFKLIIYCNLNRFKKTASLLFGEKQLSSFHDFFHGKFRKEIDVQAAFARDHETNLHRQMDIANEMQTTIFITTFGHRHSDLSKSVAIERIFCSVAQHNFKVTTKRQNHLKTISKSCQIMHIHVKIMQVQVETCQILHEEMVVSSPALLLKKSVKPLVLAHEKALKRTGAWRNLFFLFCEEKGCFDGWFGLIFGLF